MTDKPNQHKTLPRLQLPEGLGMDNLASRAGLAAQAYGQESEGVAIQN